MNWAVFHYLAPMLVGLSISIFILWTLYPKRQTASVNYFMKFVMLSAVWMGAYALELWSGSYETTLFWKKFKYLAITFTPVLWMLFSLEYTGNKTWGTHRLIMLLSVVPIVTLVIIFTNQYHHLFYVETEVAAWGPFVGVNDREGPAFWGHALYAYLLLFSGFFVILKNSLAASKLFVKQSIPLILGVMVAVVGNALFLLGLNPFPFPYDLTPSLFFVIGIAIWYDILWFRFLEVLPAARETIIENMSEGILLFNDQQYLIDINPKGCEMMTTGFSINPDYNVVGWKAQDLFVSHPELVNLAMYPQESQIEILTESSYGQHHYIVKTTPLLRHDGHISGNFMMFRNITERKKAETELERSYEQIERALRLEQKFKQNAAHFFLNPIAICKGYLELATKEGNIDEHEYLQQAHNAIQRIEKVIQNIVETGQIKE